MSEDLAEFKPAYLYMEQMLRMFPKEITVRYKMTPAFEESLLIIEEAKNEEL